MTGSIKWRLKTTWVLLLLSVVAVVVARFHIERVEQKRSVILRLGSDKEIREIAARQNAKSLRLIEAFSWSSLDSRTNLFQSNYAVYAQYATAAISLSVNRDERAIPYLKRAIKQYHKTPEALSNRPLYDLFVWGLFYINGKQSYSWFANEVDSNVDAKNYLKYVRTLLCLQDDGVCRLDVPDFIKNIHINRFDEEWPLRFYCFYCDFYNIRGFDSSEEWARHIIQNNSAVVVGKERILDELFKNSAQIMYNELTKSDRYQKTIRPLSLSQYVSLYGDSD